MRVTVLEVIVSVAIAIIIVALIIGSMPAQLGNHPTEEEAAANRQRLLLKPVQTEGLLPVPVEAPEVKPVPVSVNEIVCPHCGKAFKVKVVNDGR